MFHTASILCQVGAGDVDSTSSDGDVADEMGVCVCEVEGSEYLCWEELFLRI